MIVDFLKQVMAPASISAMLIVLAIGVGLLYWRPRWGRLWLTCVAIGYWVLSTPIGSGALAWTLATGHAPLQAADQARGAGAVVLLGGGSANVRARGLAVTYPTRPSALRVIEAARVYRLLGDPLVFLSGGITDPTPGAAPESAAYREAIIELGVPATRIVTESQSHTTREQATILEGMLRERGIARFVLVTSPLHMGRSLATFRALGLDAVPSPAPLFSDRLRAPFPLLPNDGALEIGNDVVYEWAARVYYWSNGWTRLPRPE